MVRTHTPLRLAFAAPREHPSTYTSRRRRQEKRVMVRVHLPKDRDTARIQRALLALGRDVKHSKDWTCEYCGACLLPSPPPPLFGADRELTAAWRAACRRTLPRDARPDALLAAPRSPAVRPLCECSAPLLSPFYPTYVYRLSPRSRSRSR